MENLDPVTGFQPLDERYYRYLNGIRSFLIERHLFSYKILNFEDFMEAFKKYADLMADVFPITRSGFIESSNYKIGSTGMVIELSSLEYEKDFPKGRIIQSEGFACYSKLASEYGFFVDKNGPWRLLANMESEKMQSYLKKYSLVNLSVDKILNTRYYIKSHYDDIYEIKNFAKSAYEEFVRTSPYHVTRNSNERSFLRRDPNIPLYNEEYWIEMLVNVRTSEIKHKLTKEGRGKNFLSSILSKVLNDHKVYGLNSSLGQLGQIIAKETSRKKNNKIDSFQPTKIGDYL